jgi:hypothetical protein
LLPAAGSLHGHTGTEEIYKIYAESFRGAEHLHRTVQDRRCRARGGKTLSSALRNPA